MKIKEILPRVNDDRQLRALTGLKTEVFILLIPIFEKFLTEEIKERYKYESRKPGSGRKGIIETPTEKLFFILHYLKCYPTFDHLGFSFGMPKSSAYILVNKLFPILQKTLNDFNALPKTNFATAEQMHTAFSEIETLLIDVTERAVERSVDYEKQKEDFSGKKRNIATKIPQLSL